MVDAGLGKQMSLIKGQEIRHWHGQEKNEMEQNVTNHSRGSRWRLYIQAFPHIGGYQRDHRWQAY